MTHPDRTTALELWLATPEAAAALDPASLTEAERDEWAGLQTPRRRRDWAASRRLLHAAAAHDTSCARSLSHSHAYAALALAPASTAVGVDIEWLAPREFAGMAELGFSAAEAAFIASHAEPGKCRAAFYELWTLKEACAKAFGLHLVDALRQCRFVNTRLSWEADVPAARPWRAIVYAPRPDLRLSLVWTADALESPLQPIALREWPPGNTVEWTTVRRFSGQGRLRADAC